MRNGSLIEDKPAMRPFPGVILFLDPDIGRDTARLRRPVNVRTFFMGFSGLLLLLFTANAAPADSGPGLKFYSAVLERTMGHHADFIWPDYDWNGLTVLLVDPADRQALRWRIENVNQVRRGVSTPVAFNEIPGWMLQGSWSSGTWRERLTLSVRFDPTAGDQLDRLELLYHEAFHIMGQSSWSERPGSRLRGDSYPENWEIRFFRHQLMRRLMQAYCGRDPTAIGRAIFWQQALETQYSHELRQLAGVDRIEGSAEYVGILSAAFSRYPDSAEARRNHLHRRIETLYRTKWGNFEYSRSMKEGESYGIGCMAGLILDDLDIHGWKTRVTAGETLMDVLVTHAAPIEDRGDAALKVKIEKAYTEQNERLKKVVECFKAREKDPRYLGLVLPFAWQAGSFSRQGFCYFLDDADGTGMPRQLVLGMTAGFISPDQRIHVDIDGAVVEMVTRPYPGGGFGYFYLPVKASQLEIGDEQTASIHGEQVRADHLRGGIHNVNGKRVFVPLNRE